jgi:hypothetical protein
LLLNQDLPDACCPEINMSTTPSPVSTAPSISTAGSCTASRKRQDPIPATGTSGNLPKEPGIRKALGASGEWYRKTITAALITMKVIKSVKLVTFAIKAMSPAKTSIHDRIPQIRMAIHGVL